jgi:hypothetical protein
MGNVLANLTTKAVDLGIALVKGAAAGARDLVVEFAAGARELDNWSKKTGLTTTALQQLEGAAKSLGLEAEDVREGVQTWTENLGELTRLGSGPAADALGSLGLRIEDLKDLAPEESLKVFADALRDLPSEAERTSIAMEVLGGEGSKLRPLLDQGGQGIQDLMDRASELGLVLDESAIAKGLEVSEAFKALDNTTDSLKNTIAIALAPTVTDLAERFGDWYAANADLIEQKVPETIDAIVEGTGELITYGQELAGGLENLTGLFTRMGEEGQDGMGGLVEMGQTAVEWSKAGIETFVEWTDDVAEMADLVWDVADAIKDGLGAAYEYVEPVVDTVTAAFEDQESTLGRVVVFVEGLVDRVLYLKDQVVGLVDDIGLGKAVDVGAMIDAAQAAAQAPVAEARAAAVAELAAEGEARRIGEARQQARSDAARQEIAKTKDTKALRALLARTDDPEMREAIERRLRAEQFRRKTFGGGGAGKVDTTEAEARLGAEITALAQASGATDKARRAAMVAAAKQLDEGAGDDVARKAAASVLTSKTGVDLSAQGGADAALFGRLTQIGGADAARHATDGARFVTIDQSQHNTITVNVPEQVGSALTPDGAAEVFTAAVRRVLVEDYRQIIERGDGALSP